MAMSLLEAGVPPHRFRIDAVDISAQVLARAQRAEYGKNSFRGADLAFRDRYFEPTAGGYKLNDVVRQQVRYRQGNLMSPGFLPGEAIFDIIFCRNLLIYFDVAGRDQAVRVLRRLLAVGGVLFVGPSETALLLDNGFVSLKRRLAFAFREDVAADHPKRSAPVPAVHIPLPWRASKRSQTAHSTEPAKSSGPTVPVAAAEPRLEEASRLADQGRLTEAAQHCEAHLRKHGPSAPALHLMGLILAAAGELQAAAEHYRKALYLNPRCHDTLLHLGFLLEKQGDAPGARRIRDRLLRLPVPGKVS